MTVEVTRIISKWRHEADRWYISFDGRLDVYLGKERVASYVAGEWTKVRRLETDRAQLLEHALLDSRIFDNWDDLAAMTGEAKANELGTAWIAQREQALRAP